MLLAVVTTTHGLSEESGLSNELIVMYSHVFLFPKVRGW